MFRISDHFNLPTPLFITKMVVPLKEIPVKGCLISKDSKAASLVTTKKERSASLNLTVKSS